MSNIGGESLIPLQVDRFSLTVLQNSDTIPHECRAQNLEGGNNGVNPSLGVCAPPTASISPRILFHSSRSTNYRCPDKEVPREQRSKAQPAHIPAPVRSDGGQRRDRRLWRRSASRRSHSRARSACTDHGARGACPYHASRCDGCSSRNDPVQRSAHAGKTGAGR